MAEKTINTRQKQKYDTSVNWTTNNPILFAGEIGIESDTNKFKIGNGTSAWNELDYAGGGEVVLYSTTGQNTDGAMTQKATTDALPQCIEIEMNMQTGQASITVEQFEKLLENPENYIVVNMSLTDSDGSTRTESVKFIRGSYRKAETSSYWVEHLFFNSVNTGDTEKTPYMYLILARHSISPNDIGIGMGGEEYATVNQLNNKVYKVNNMGLSTNDYTTADKNKLAGIEAGAEVNPTSLSELSEDATHRLVTDTEKSTWNAKSDFSGSYNDLTDKPTISTINVDSQPQSTLNFDSDPQTQIDNIANNRTKIQNQNEGFSAGNHASATSGGAVGRNAESTSGGAVGSGARTSRGFAGGYNARAQDAEGNGIDAIQLGTGTNITERTLKIYNDNIYNASTHTLTVQNATVGGNEVDTIEEQGTNYIRYSNGIQFCWGSQSWSSRNNGTFNVTFPKAFSSTPSITATATSPNLGGSASSPLTLYGENTTGFQGTVWGVGGGDRNDGMRWIAIGKWS